MSLLIGEHIQAKLVGSEKLKKLVGDRIFAISTKTETSFPFIVYKRNELTPNYTKDRYSTGDSTAVEVIVAADNYFNSICAAQLVRDALEGKRGKYDDFNVINAKVLFADEDFIADTFIQRITFSFETE